MIYMRREGWGVPVDGSRRSAQGQGHLSNKQVNPTGITDTKFRHSAWGQAPSQASASFVLPWGFFPTTAEADATPNGFRERREEGEEEGADDWGIERRNKVHKSRLFSNPLIEKKMLA